MGKFINELGSTYWWISVVIVGLLINIIAGFGFKYFDRLLARFSINRRSKREEKEAEDQIRIAELRINDFEKVIQSSYILYLRLQVITYLIFAILYSILILLFYTSEIGAKLPRYTLKVLVSPILLILLFFTYQAMKLMRLSQRENRILWKARKG